MIQNGAPTNFNIFCWFRIFRKVFIFLLVAKKLNIYSLSYLKFPQMNMRLIEKRITRMNFSENLEYCGNDDKNMQGSLESK